jgi:alkanesulfonate monooxygenase SsuD/methylene tetrahydromethanopterin reductase-like flavin-dependent oxidoreductase (luciferase family)
MKFGLNFFPTQTDEEKPAAQYFAECMQCVDLVDELGYDHVRIVEHYFEPYGGHSPNPVIFLTAASQHTKRAKVITGAVLPVFNNPLKLAGELGMLDAFSNGRLEIGFARAFLPHEFERFGVSMDESRGRFDEGVEQIRMLLSQTDATHEGRFHSFRNVTSLPRPTQRPHPPFWVAAFMTKESFVNAGRNGFGIMAIPTAGPVMHELIGEYREAWRSAGHPGQGRIMLAQHMYCGESEAEVLEYAEPAVNGYLKTLVDCIEPWANGMHSKDYPGYEKMVDALRDDDFKGLRSRNIALCGTPDEIRDMIETFYMPVPGGVDHMSMQVNFHNIPIERATASMRRFAREVMPYYDRVSAASAAA